MCARHNKKQRKTRILVVILLFLCYYAAITAAMPQASISIWREPTMAESQKWLAFFFRMENEYVQQHGGLNPSWDLSVCSLHVIPALTYLDFLPQSHNTHMRLSGVSKLHGWVFCCFYFISIPEQHQSGSASFYRCVPIGNRVYAAANRNEVHPASFFRLIHLFCVADRSQSCWAENLLRKVPVFLRQPIACT